MSSSDDAAVWREVGHDLISNYMAVMTKTFVMAVYSILVFKTTRILRTKHRTKVSLYTCIAVLIMYSITIVLWIIDAHNFVIEVQTTMLQESTDSLADKYSTSLHKTLRLVSAEDFLYSYLTIIGDGIIIWRVFAFWSSPRERFVILIPSAFLLGSIATSTMLTYCAARLGSNIDLGTYQHPAFCRNIQTASYSTTLATTAVATSLIAWKTWKYRKMHFHAFGSASPQTKTMKVMTVLIESGILYMIFFTVAIVESDGTVNAGIQKNQGLVLALTIYQFNSSLIVAIYPTIIVLLVNSDHSVLNSTVDHSTSGIPTFRRPQLTDDTLSRYTNDTSAITDTVATEDADLSVYELSRLRGKASEEGLKRTGSTRVHVQRSVVFDVDP